MPQNELAAAADVTASIYHCSLKIRTWNIQAGPLLVDRNEGIMDCVLSFLSRAQHEHGPPCLPLDLYFIELSEPDFVGRVSSLEGQLLCTPIVARRHRHTTSTFLDADLIQQRGVSPQSSSLRAEMKTSPGTSTRPIDFIFFLPSFCFSSSLRFRVMSPP